ncbi:FAD:protein FMN transferase [Amphibacillus sp. MSJ-3]|uniref:FAD:protein FMN transferase n=1 Tax=Amphibacillus sp. MSJ-3 TaxID=2841505 RepID=UPI001C0ED89F|nr:FAD:protein FMN transferase [Amphibacillus sp. MSJ-3]MBU5594559.1 FAD:protein FMN transferase [Amphibacillus sp. MSJ-3]
MPEAKSTLYLMGTTIKIWIKARYPKELLETVEAQLLDYEKRFSANSEGSQLAKINHASGQKAIPVEADLFELIRIGKEQSLVAGSFLNIAIGPLIKAWRIGFEDARQPSAREIQALLTKVDPRKIHLDEDQQTVFLAEKGMALDLGAIAKGYFADKILAFLKAEGAESAYIDLGGNVFTFGDAPHHKDGFWRVGIQNPFLPRGQFVSVLKIKNRSIVTSGIYERKLVLGDQIYHHIIDSRTGYPSQTDLASLTIISNTSLEGEIWTTRLFGKSAIESIRELNDIPNIEGIVITTDSQLAYTNELASYLEEDSK